MVDSISAGGGLVVVDNTPDPLNLDSYGDLKQQAARIVGGQNDRDVLRVAGEGLRECIDDINTRHFYEFMTEVQADYSLVEGQTDYDLDTSIYALRSVQLVLADGGDNEGPFRELQYMPFEQMLRQYEDQRNEGWPDLWSFRDLHTESELIFFPVPNADAATRLDVRVTGMARVPQFVDDDAVVIAAPREMNVALKSYARYHVLKNFQNEERGLWEHEWARYRDSLDSFTGKQRRVSRGRVQMRVEGTGRFTRTTWFRR